MTFSRITLSLLALALSLPAAAQQRADIAGTGPRMGCANPEAAKRIGPGGVTLDCRAVFDVVTENDFYVTTTDQWYTTGTRLAYLRPEQMPEDLPAPVRWLDRQLSEIGWFGPANTRYGLSFGQNIYTPVNVLPHNPDPKDRPYAGFSYFDFTVLRRNADFQDRFTLQLGLLGPGSWGRNSQDFVHRLLNQDVSHGWKYQLRQEWSFGVGWDRVYRFPMTQKLFGLLEVDALPSMAVQATNIQVYGQLGGRMRVGRALEFDFGPGRMRPGPVDGAAPIRGDGRLGWYVFVGAAGRAVGRDATVEGNSFKPSRGVPLQRGVADFDFGAAVNLPIGDRYVRLGYTHNYRTQEFVGQKRWFQFGSLNLTYTW
jgi:hypothetical protein